MYKIRLINIPHLFVFLSVRTVSKLVEFRNSFSVFVSISMELCLGLYNCDLLAWNKGRITDLSIDGSTLIKCTSKTLDVKCFVSTARRHTGGAEVRFHSFLTSRWVVSFIQGSLCLRETNPVSPEEDAGWSREPVWTFWKREKSLACIEIRTPDRLAR
jgi:hypothetical protein